MEKPTQIHTVHVVATSLEGTRAALKAAARVAASRRARLVLLVPDVTPPAIAQSPLAANWLIARYEEMARAVDQPVAIRLCKTTSAAEVALRLTPPDAVVYVGGTSTWLWPSAEERLAARLTRSGRAVVFVGQGVDAHA